MVGEDLLTDLDLLDDPGEDPVSQLLSFALRIYDFAVSHPGLPAYLQTLFPRGAGGERLIAHQVSALGRRGYMADAAIMLSSAAASLAIGYAAATDNQRAHADGLAEQRAATLDRLLEHAELREPHLALPQISMEDYVRLVLTAAIRGLVFVAPPGRAVAEVVADLSADSRQG